MVESYFRDHFGRTRGASLHTVRAYRDYLPDLIPLPHPSPRNQLWFKMNPWFESELVPVLRDHIANALDRNSPPPRPIRRPDAT